MVNNTALLCDGCGQLGSPEHIARRLRRLEWATRYRPVHIQALLLGGIAPREDAEFLYAPAQEFSGEAAFLLRAVGISPEGKAAEAVHVEFQAAGFFLAHILECPLKTERVLQTGTHGSEDPPLRGKGQSNSTEVTALLRKHLPAVASRIRRSLKPRRVILVTEMPPEVVQDILALDLGCEVILNDGRPFALAPSVNEAEISRFRAVLDSRTMR